jgi:signal recognition particle GTPase
MDEQQLTTRIDEALDMFRGRDLVTASEVVDLLLDLRLMLLAADEEARAAPAGA